MSLAPAQARALETIHNAKYDGETCHGCRACYLREGVNYVPASDCPECFGLGCSSHHVQDILDDLCEHGVLGSEVCTVCWDRAQQVAIALRRELERNTFGGRARC